MNGRTNLQYAERPAPFAEPKSNEMRGNPQPEKHRSDIWANVYDLLSEKEQRACNQATD